METKNKEKQKKDPFWNHNWDAARLKSLVTQVESHGRWVCFFPDLNKPVAKGRPKNVLWKNCFAKPRKKVFNASQATVSWRRTHSWTSSGPRTQKNHDAADLVQMTAPSSCSVLSILLQCAFVCIDEMFRRSFMTACRGLQRCCLENCLAKWVVASCLLAFCTLHGAQKVTACFVSSWFFEGWQEQQIDVEIVVGLCNEENVSNERKHIFREQVNCGRNNIMCHNGCIWSLLCVAFGFELFWQVSLDGLGNFKTLETFQRHHWCDVVDDSHQVRHQLLGSFHWFGLLEKDQAGPGRVRSLKSAACEHGKTRLRCALMKNKISCSGTSRNFFCPVGGNTGMPKKKWLLVLAKIL